MLPLPLQCGYGPASWFETARALTLRSERSERLEGGARLLTMRADRTHAVFDWGQVFHGFAVNFPKFLGM
jgi:hypothetical protein